MPRKALLNILAAFAIAIPSLSFSQLPSADRIQADLNGPFLTSAPLPSMAHRGEIAVSVEKLMSQQARYLISTLHPYTEDNTALLLTDGNSGEHGIRPNARMVHGLATMARLMTENYGDKLTSETCRDKALAVLRFVLPAHKAGGLKCSDGKQWYGQWQSALWAYSAGKGAWLLWNDLTPEMKWLTARMICDEADRFVGQPPPFQVKSDTKAEENAWNSQVIALAYNMFPNHPNHAKYRDTAIQWAITSFCRQADLTDSTPIDGRPLKEWMTGANIHDDYTLENHDRVHPDYMGTINLLISQEPLYAWAGNTVPKSLRHNVNGVYDVLRKMAMPDGSVVYPNGQDWQIHRNPIWLVNHLEQALLNNDASAAFLMRLSLEAIEKMAARRPDWGVYLPEEFFFPSTQMDMLVYLADAYVLLRSAGDGPQPLPAEQVWKQLEGVHLFHAGSFVICRSRRSVSTFSWGQQIMGMAMPLQEEILLTPNERSLIGRMELVGAKREVPKTREIKIGNLPGLFSVSGILDRGNGVAEQRFAFAVLSDGQTLYCDSLVSTQPQKIKSLRMGTISILNEPTWIFGDAKRTLKSETERRTFVAAPPSPSPVSLRSSWLNVDNALGILSPIPMTSQYSPSNRWDRGRIEDILDLSVPLKLSGKTSANLENCFVLLPGYTEDETQKAAARLKTDGEGSHRNLILPGGQNVSINLDELRVTLR